MSTMTKALTSKYAFSNSAEVGCSCYSDEDEEEDKIESSSKKRMKDEMRWL
jgi:hypothetical protein